MPIVRVESPAIRRWYFTSCCSWFCLGMKYIKKDPSVTTLRIVLSHSLATRSVDVDVSSLPAGSEQMYDFLCVGFESGIPPKCIVPSSIRYEVVPAFSSRTYSAQSVFLGISIQYGIIKNSKGFVLYTSDALVPPGEYVVVVANTSYDVNVTVAEFNVTDVPAYQATVSFEEYAGSSLVHKSSISTTIYPSIYYTFVYDPSTGTSRPSCP